MKLNNQSNMKINLKLLKKGRIQINQYFLYGLSNHRMLKESTN